MTPPYLYKNRPAMMGDPAHTANPTRPPAAAPTTVPDRTPIVQIFAYAANGPEKE